MKPLPPGALLQNRYEIGSLIGRGGMGEVYLAVDRRLGHSVALKRTTVGDDVALAEAFEQEARTLAQLRHPVLPKVSDHFLEDGEQFLVMDYIDGEDLSTRLKDANKPFPLNWVLFWADQLLEALEYLHKYNPPIIHRDIKPQNLKLTPENNVILLDFGLSKQSIGDTKVTSSGSIVGYTPHYAPMEQIRGTGTDARSDIYSLCSTLYHLLTGEVPPDALTRADALLAGSPDPLKPLTGLNPEISEELSEIIINGMEISQEKRFGSARDMQKELRRAFNSLQDSMSAETVAFNVADEDFSGADEKTEVISGAELGAIVPGAEVSDDSGDVSTSDSLAGAEEDFSADKKEVINKNDVREIAEDENFDSTMKKGIFPVEEVSEESEPVTQEYPAVDEFSDTDEANVYETSEDVGDVVEDFSEPTPLADEIEEAEDSSLPAATVPLISLDSEAQDVVDEGGDERVSIGDSENVEQKDFTEPEAVPEKENSAAVAAASSEKSSTGKYLAVLGGMGALLLLLLGTVFAVGWYVTNGTFSMGPGDADAEPSTMPSIEESPAVEETTPEISNTDVLDNGNTNENANTSDNQNANVEPNTNVANEKRPTVEAKPTIAPATPRPTRTPRKVKTPTPRKTVRPRATRKPTPKATRPKPKPTRKPRPRVRPTIVQ